MRTWLAAAAVTIVSSLLKASGPLALGNRSLPPRMVAVSALVAPALLSGLLITEINPIGWAHVNWQQVSGVGIAGLCSLARVPLLASVLLGVAATAILRAWALVPPGFSHHR